MNHFRSLIGLALMSLAIGFASLTPAQAADNIDIFSLGAVSYMADSGFDSPTTDGQMNLMPAPEYPDVPVWAQPGVTLMAILNNGGCMMPGGEGGDDGPDAPSGELDPKPDDGGGGTESSDAMFATFGALCST